MNPISSVQEGTQRIDSFIGKAEEFELCVPSELLDPIGINMAIITDRILAKGWQPNGFEPCKEGRIYHFKSMD
jgi:hypothetical protein